MYGTQSSRMFYNTTTNKIVLMFQGYTMTLLSQFPLHTNASCMFVTLLLSFTENSLLLPQSQSGQAYLDYYKLLLARRSPPIKFASLSHVRKRPRHVTCVSVLARHPSQKIKIRGPWPRKNFFGGTNPLP